MPEIIGVRFKSVGKIFYFDPCSETFQQGDPVIVETTRGVECGTVMQPNRQIDENELPKPLKPIIRAATEEDLRQIEANQEREKKAFDICLQKIAVHKLQMKLIDTEITFDGSKILFYFTADGRVDFRELVKDLASVFRTRIELRQVGVRDEAKMLGGLGICGRPFCCASFLGDFQPVSIKMAKEQGLSLNPTKISGTCGRLMCCLKYESDVYEELLAQSFKPGAIVNTPDGRGMVLESTLLTGDVKVRLDRSDDAIPHVYKRSELTSVRWTAPSAPQSAPAAAESPAPAPSDAPSSEDAD